MIELGSPAHRARIIGMARKAKADIEQYFTDIASWNANSKARKNGAAPIDPDPDGRMRKMLDGLTFMLAAEDAHPGVGPIEHVITGDDEDDIARDSRTRQ